MQASRNQRQSSIHFPFCSSKAERPDAPFAGPRPRRRQSLTSDLRRMGVFSARPCLIWRSFNQRHETNFNLRQTCSRTGGCPFQRRLHGERRRRPHPAHSKGGCSTGRRHQDARASVESQLDSELSATAFDAQRTVSFRSERITARQALAALLDNYDLVMIEDAAKSATRITQKSDPERKQP